MSHFIQDNWIEGEGDFFHSTDPMNHEVIWEGKEATSKEIDQAVSAAQNATESWAALTFDERVKQINRFKTTLEKQKKELATLISQEVGKPLWESIGEVNSMLSKIPISIEAHQERASTRALSDQLVVHHKPHGVVAVFAPFNFPAHLPNGHIIPALLAGNTVVLKSSEHTPAVAKAMVKCWEHSKLPAGVLNLVQGKAKCGQYLATHPHINALFFTGSWHVGSELLSNFSKHPEKILALEMGGNNPLVVSKVGDETAAALLTIQSAYATSGQRCSCARRLIVVEENLRYLETLIAMIQAIQVGDFRNDPEPFMGPVVSIEQKDRLLQAQSDLRKKGAAVLVEMTSRQEGTPLLSPGLIDVTGLEIPDEEHFGPLLQLIRVKDFDEAIKVANQTEYGLSAGLLSRHEKEFECFFKQIKAGLINWNQPTTGASSHAPFGGIGKSGNYRPSAYYAADYCAYPVTSSISQTLRVPETLPKGIRWKK